MTAIISFAARAVTMLAAVGSLGLWVRSYHVSDRYARPVTCPAHSMPQYDRVEMLPGRVLIYRTSGLF